MKNPSDHRGGPMWPPAVITDGLAKQFAQFPRIALRNGAEKNPLDSAAGDHTGSPVQIESILFTVPLSKRGEKIAVLQIRNPQSEIHNGVTASTLPSS